MRQFMHRVYLISAIISFLFIFAGCAGAPNSSATQQPIAAQSSPPAKATPTIEQVHAQLQKVQNDLETIAANANPTVQTATTVAGIVEVASGNPGLVPITNMVSAALQATNTAIAAKQAAAKAANPTPSAAPVSP